MAADSSRFESLDVDAFQAFYWAAQTENFTEAAALAHMTQPGVSQHVGHLEEQLGIPLFTRMHRRVILTDAGKQLHRYVERFFDEQAQLKQRLVGEFAAPAGPVRYAMPESCLLSPHFSMLLAARAKSFPGVKLDVTLCPSEGVTQRLLSGEADFGFITTRERHPSIHYTPFCNEEYILVGPGCGRTRTIDVDTLLKAPFVEHPSSSELFGMWRGFHFSKHRRLRYRELSIVGRNSSLRGAIMMVQGGVGLTVLPAHTVAHLLASGEVTRYQHKKGSVQSMIQLATPDDVRLPRRVQVVIDAFMEMVS